MEILELNQMEKTQGGKDCETAAGAWIGLSVGLTIATVATGGLAAFAIAGLAVTVGGGSLLGGFCLNDLGN